MVRYGDGGVRLVVLLGWTVGWAGCVGVASGSGRNSGTRCQSHRRCPSFIIYTPTHGKTVQALAK